MVNIQRVSKKKTPQTVTSLFFTIFFLSSLSPLYLLSHLYPSSSISSFSFISPPSSLYLLSPIYPLPPLSLFPPSLLLLPLPLPFFLSPLCALSLRFDLSFPPFSFTPHSYLLSFFFLCWIVCLHRNSSSPIKSAFTKRSALNVFRLF